ncbi:SDR family NAD(P)-dependent oxidoreductase [Kaistia dalseonensis]|uniref:NAD(P)-dependent dehydrogenase (Short-subunit alcohol dehydrogenase family) n=1 Tax=Kaistia dalseonensis TaxID=410840 RepID=A0ABU0H431_9HYPH|nr:SDR family oxidoreductase [Kaistia dalseonensis]MCX5494461.1 SDR family NAD(P)-dependent oxidoreductase [Kaistia dalseonensis]MDQ0437040.1 NAD(P)-dependent dehydrogenase (short-subunit alcohol dehydrogenase family) [Kaistia dalseonensis]
MDLNLQGKRVVVTGSATGIGRATAEVFLREGAEVVINGLTETEVAAAIASLSPHGAVSGLAADIATAEGANALLDFAKRDGAVDVLVNNVGIFSVKPFEEITDADWLHYFNVNVLTAVRMTRAILPAMLERGTGAVVNLASEAGVKPLPQMVHYSVTKTAMIGLTRGLAELTKGTAVTVNAVLPGPTWTDGVEAYFRGLAAAKSLPMDGVIESYFRQDEPTSLIQRFVKPDEVARMIAFVASSPASNGAAYRIEGGIIRSIL